jgi:hypothetical protein
MDTLQDKKKRRSKKDSDGRFHACECGKSYLSYQALYTHKRTKHIEAIQIEEAPKKKRGRPKGMKPGPSEYDPCFPLGDNPLVQRIHTWKDIEKKDTCDDIFAEFLIERSKTLSKKEYRYTAGRILGLRDCINKSYHVLNDNSITAMNEDYTKIKGPGLLPKISNEYILNYLPSSKPEHDKEVEVKFMLDLCNWLMEKNYTDLEVSVLS